MNQRPWIIVLTLANVALGGAYAGTVSGQVKLGNKGASNAVVYVHGIKAVKPPQKRVVLHQKNQLFSPRVMAILVNTVVDFPNDDKIFHNVFSFRDGKRFDLGMYPPGAVKSETFSRPGLVKVFCNIHANMSAFIWVLENPYFAVTDAQGKFVIRDVPPGTHQLRVWHENALEANQEIMVGAEATTVEFALKKS